MSLREVLETKYPGSKSVLEAFEKAKASLVKDPDQVILYKAMRKTIDDISSKISFKQFDVDFMNKELKRKLDNMPLKTLEDVRRFRDAWLKNV